MNRILILLGLLFLCMVFWYLVLEIVDWLITNMPDLMGKIRWRK